MRFITYLDILMWEFAYDGTSDGLVSSNDGTSQCDYYIDFKSLVVGNRLSTIPGSVL